jgi:hypothetical protein
MRRLELFKALCEVNDALEKAIEPMVYSATREAIAAVVDRLDALIDRCVREGVQPLHAADRSPCPACGQACCTHWQVLQGARPVAQEGAP